MIYISDGQLEHLRHVLEVPELIAGRYEISERIGAGGMGHVYRARDRALDRTVAIKVLSLPDESGDLTRRLTAEAHITARLEHPSIVPVHDVGKLEDGRVYYVMKYVRGERLDRFLTSDTGLTERLRVFQRICEAVEFAHAQGIIHRDLKPENIMVGPFGEVLIMDWGVAKSLSGGAGEEVLSNSAGAGLQVESQTGHTSPGTVIGTPGYMAPEQATGDRDVDARADVYGLGAVLYHILTGQAPVEHASDRPRRLNRSIARPAEAVCLKAMAPAREHRYQSVTPLSRDVSSLLEKEPVSAYRENIWERMIRLANRHQFIILLLGAYLVVRIFLYIFRIR